MVKTKLIMVAILTLFVAVVTTFNYGGCGGGGLDSQWRIEKRDITTGALVGAFDTDGVITTNPSANLDTPYAIVVDDNYIYVAGDDGTNGLTDLRWRVEKRDKTTGALVAGFGTGGVYITDFGANDDYINAIVQDANALYIAGVRTASAGNTLWMMLKLDKATGTAVSAFGTSGLVAIDPSTGEDEPCAITLDTSGDLYVAGYATIGGTDEKWMLAKINSTTGALVTGFGQNGTVVVNPGNYDDEANAIVVDDNYLYLAGEQEVVSFTDIQWRIERRSKTTGGQ